MRSVTLVTATLGEQGEVIGDELQGLVADRADQLGGYRLTELRAACAALGITDHRMLGGLGEFRDSGMAGTPSAAHPRAFVRAAPGGPDHARAVAGLVEVIDEIEPAVLLTYDADGGYGHPDHVAAHQVAMAAVARRGWRVPRVLAVVRPPAATRCRVCRLRPAPAGYLTARRRRCRVPGRRRPVAVAVPTAPGAGPRRPRWPPTRPRWSCCRRRMFALSNRIAQPLADRGVLPAARR